MKPYTMGHILFLHKYVSCCLYPGSRMQLTSYERLGVKTLDSTVLRLFCQMHFPHIFCQWLTGQGRLSGVGWIQESLEKLFPDTSCLPPDEAAADCLTNIWDGSSKRGNFTSPDIRSILFWFSHSLTFMDCKWKRMMITFEGRVERVERVCHVSVSISSHAFTGIPNL